MEKNVPFVSAKSGWNQAARWLTLAGALGPVLYIVVFTLAGFLRPGYSPIQQAVSDLGVGSNAWLLNADCIVFGVLLVAFAVGFSTQMRPVLRKGLRVTCLVLLILSGLGAINAGIFTEAPATVTLHWTLGFQLAVLPPVIVCAIVGWQWRRLSGWQAYGRYSLFVAGGTTVFILLSFVFFSPSLPMSGVHIGGLVERILALLVFTWHVVVGWRLFVLAGSPQTAEAHAVQGQAQSPKRGENTETSPG